jgi:ABC-type polysaccharide/polyol phosphate export permease
MCNISLRFLSKCFFTRARLVIEQQQFQKNGADFFCLIRLLRSLKDCDGAFWGEGDIDLSAVLYILFTSLLALGLGLLLFKRAEREFADLI